MHALLPLPLYFTHGNKLPNTNAHSYSFTPLCGRLSEQRGCTVPTVAAVCLCVLCCVQTGSLSQKSASELRLQLNYRVCDAQHIPLCFGAFNFVAERGPLSPNSGVCGKLSKVYVDR